MRTGIRCTTFTQLPVAFCGGSERKLRACSLADALHLSPPPASGIGVDFDLRLLARLDKR